MVRYDAWRRTSGSDLALRQRDGGVVVLKLLARAHQVGPLLQSHADSGVDVRWRSNRWNEIGGLQTQRPVVGTLGIDDQQAEVILRLSHQRLRDDQILATLGDFCLCRDEIERRRLADVDARPIVSLELERQIE